jgi:hypothetical protein
MTFARAFLFLLGLSPASALCGCGSSQPNTEEAAPVAEDASTTFIAFASNFSNFQSWTHYPALGVADGGAGDPVHTDPTLVEYINQRAPSASSPFPVGTIIVKEGSEGDPLTRQFFAMVKRGGDYNATGAIGWEWFELQNQADPPNSVSIIWRGFGPHAGEIYGGDAKAGCNECHLGAPHDFVFADQAIE